MIIAYTIIKYKVLFKDIINMLILYNIFKIYN